MPPLRYFLKLYIFIVLIVLSPLSAHAQQGESPASPFDEAVNTSRANMMRDPTVALAEAERAEALANRADVVEAATAVWLQSESLTRLGRPDEARPVAERALSLLGENPIPTKLFADILLSLGRAVKMSGEHGIALDYYQRAYEVYAHIGDTRSQAIALQSMGSIYNDARQYERAVQYFSDATERHSDASLDLAAANNLGNAYRELGQYTESLASFEQALSIAREMESGMLEARILNNVAALHIAQENWVAADEAVSDAFSVAGDPEGAEWGRFFYGARAQVSLGQERPAEARLHIDRVFDGVDITATNHHYTDFHYAAARIFEQLGEFELAIDHFEAFKRLDDESRGFAASANAALVGAQFDFAEQELEIQQLLAEGLESELALERSNTRQRVTIAIGAGVLLLALLGVTFVVLLNFRSRNRLMKNLLFEDTETGLPTRQALIRDRNKAIMSGQPPVYFAAIKLDRATNFETMLGFASFVELQKQLGARLEQIDGVQGVGLIGHGVFGAILDTDDELLLVDEISQLSQAFTKPIQINSVNMDITATIGLDNIEQSELAARNAIIAISQARQKQTAHAFFNSRRFGNPTENLSLMTRMMDAIQSGDMELHYQPKLDLRSGRFTSVEALSRWTDPTRGSISPDNFIPQAEETGRIRELTEWSVREALEAKKQLAQDGFDINFAVNISGRLVTDQNFGKHILEIVGFGVSGLTFEITETAMMVNPEVAIHNLALWADAGIKLAIDDYGTGYSSLAYIKRLPCHELKLDKTFIDGVKSDAKDRTLVKSTVDLAHNLGMKLTAEGVEDDITLTALKAMGCDYAQGYCLSKAISARDLVEFLRQSAIADERLEARPNQASASTA